MCDAFDAMISDRSYRSAIPVVEALEELSRHAGTQFDPKIVETFQTLIGELKRGELETRCRAARFPLTSSPAAE